MTNSEIIIIAIAAFAGGVLSGYALCMSVARRAFLDMARKYGWGR